MYLYLEFIWATTYFAQATQKLQLVAWWVARQTDFLTSTLEIKVPRYMSSTKVLKISVLGKNDKQIL